MIWYTSFFFSSDKEEAKTQERVRSRSNFRQGRGKNARACLKSSQLQDKEEAKTQERVRSRANFGQGRGKNARACPKSIQLRTRKRQKRKSVSEVDPTSNTVRRSILGNVYFNTFIRSFAYIPEVTFQKS